MSERAVAHHCPYCADENLFPREEHGAWDCRSCLRAFSLKFLGQLPHPESARRYVNSTAEPGGAQA